MPQSLGSHNDRLIALAKEGDPDALGVLLDQYRAYLGLLARLQIHRRLQAKADASDILQETFLQAHRNFEQFQGVTEAELLNWLRRIMASCIGGLVRHYYGTQSRDPRLETDIAGELDRSSQALDRSLSQTTPSAFAARREQAVVLSDALEKLTSDYREVIVLHHLQGLSFPDVANKMSRTPEAVRKLWVRALAQLKSSLGDVT